MIRTFPQPPEPSQRTGNAKRYSTGRELGEFRSVGILIGRSRQGSGQQGGAAVP